MQNTTHPGSSSSFQSRHSRSAVKPALYKTAMVVQSPTIGDQFVIGEFVGVEYAGQVFNATSRQTEDSYRIFTGHRQAYVLASYLGKFCL